MHVHAHTSVTSERNRVPRSGPSTPASACSKPQTDGCRVVCFIIIARNNFSPLFCSSIPDASIFLAMPRRRRPARPGALADLAPTKILSQIVVLQIVYYGIAAALILFSTLVAGSPVTIDLLLSWKTVRADITTGWLLALCWMMDSLLWYVT